MKRIALSVLICVIACSPSEGDLSGDVFIVTRGGQNIKLGLITVSAIPFGVLQAHVDIKTREVEELVVGVMEKRDEVEKEVITEELIWGKSVKAIGLQARIDSLTARAENYHASALFEDLPPAIATAKTDADGKFTMMLPRTGSFGIVARASRQVGNKTETYSWIEQVSLEGEASKRVMLSNDNLLKWVRPTSR